MAGSEPPNPTLLCNTASQSSLRAQEQEDKCIGIPAVRTDSHESSVSIQTATSGGVRNYLTASVQPSLIAETELVLLTIFTGMQDAVSFPDYHCFMSNQTGNTVFLMLAIIMPSFNGDMFVTANIAMALALFLAASCITGQIGHIVGPRNRLWLIACNLIQAALVFAAGAIQMVHGVQTQGPLALAGIALLSFAAGSQVVQSRALAMTEISTAMATAAWVDLAIDRRLFAAHNHPRTRRVVFLSALILGALLGAVIYRTAGSAVVILVSGAGKAVVAFLYLFNEVEKPKAETSKA